MMRINVETLNSTFSLAQNKIAELQSHIKMTFSSREKIKILQQYYFPIPKICLSLIIVISIDVFVCLFTRRINHKPLQKRDITKHFSHQSFSNVIEEDTIICPSYKDVSSVPEQCPTFPKYPQLYNSSFFPMWKPGNPGPSEQTQGTKHVLMAAALLNKGITLSNYTKHKSDHESVFEIPFGIRNNLEIMCQYFNLHSLEFDENDKKSPLKIDKLRNQRVDAILNIRFALIPLEQQVGRFACFNRSVETYLEKHSGAIPKYNWPSIDMDQVELEMETKEHFPNNPKSDLLYFFEKYNMRYGEKPMIATMTANNWMFPNATYFVDQGGAYRMREMEADSAFLDIDEETAAKYYRIDKNLIYDSYKASSHPKFIQDLARMFIKVYMANYQFMSVHFRFNPGDFISGKILTSTEPCDFEHISSDRCFGIKGVSSRRAEELRKSLQNSTYFLEKMVGHFRTTFADELDHDDPDFLSTGGTPKKLIETTKIIYIASPLNIAEIFHAQGRIYHDQKSNQKYKIFNTLDMIQFLDDKIRPHCWALDTYYGDVLSTIEKEMLLISKIFYRARPSNWSFNVQGHRNSEYSKKELRLDRVIFDIFAR